MNQKFDLSKLISTSITFESLTPLIVNGVEIPLIDVGYKGKYIGTIAQYNKDCPHAKEGILPGQWFCLMSSGNVKLDTMLNSIEPAGRELEELKRLITHFVNRYIK